MPGTDTVDCDDAQDPVSVSEYQDVDVPCTWIGGSGAWVESGGEERLIAGASECDSGAESQLVRIDTTGDAFTMLDPILDERYSYLGGLTACAGGDVNADGVVDVLATWIDDTYAGAVILDPWSDSPVPETPTELRFDRWTISYLTCAYAGDRVLVGAPVYAGGGRIFGYAGLAAGVYSDAETDFQLFSTEGDVGLGNSLENVGDLDGNGQAEVAILAYSGTWLVDGEDLDDLPYLDELRSSDTVYRSGAGAVAGGADLNGDGLDDWAVIRSEEYEDTVVEVLSGFEPLTEIHLAFDLDVRFGDGLELLQGESNARLVVTRQEFDADTELSTRGELLAYEGPFCGVLDADQGAVIPLEVEPKGLGTLTPDPLGLSLAFVLHDMADQSLYATVTLEE